MDHSKILAELHAQLKQIEQTIAILEELSARRGSVPSDGPRKRVDLENILTSPIKKATDEPQREGRGAVVM